MTTSNLILDRYRPLGQAGAGGFGTVQVAWDQRIQRKVAIKTILLTELDAFRASLPGAEAVAGSGVDRASQRREPLPWEEGFEGFDEVEPEGELEDDLVPALAHIPGLDEARTAAMLADPRIVTVYDFEVRDRMAYLIMEYVEGLTLTELLDGYGSELSLDEIAAIFTSVAGALEHAHGSGVLHLDIKPDNILINANGQVKVTDFGLATLADAAGLGTTGGGTIGYMPPEQMRRENLDARCDEWSLASITYEMLTGSNPFIVPRLDQAEEAIVDAELILPSLCWEGLDPEVDDVVFYALDPDREERYASVTDFADEMVKFLGDAEVGQERLAAIVCDELGLEIDDEYGEWDDPDAPVRVRKAPRPHRSLSEILSPRVVAAGGRVCAALLSGFVAAVAVSNMSFVLMQTTSAPFAVLLAAIAVGALGILRPDFGGVASFALLGVALVMGNSPLPGVVLLVATAAWWYFVGRMGAAESNAALVEPLAGSIGFAAFSPLVAGAYLRPLNAIGTAAFACVVALVTASFGSDSLYGWNALSFWHFVHADVQAHFMNLLFAPSTWCVAGSWIAAAALEAFAGTRLGKIGVWLGYLLGCAVLIAGAGMAVALATNFASFVPGIEVIVPIVLSTAILVAAELALRAISAED